MVAFARVPAPSARRRRSRQSGSTCAWTAPRVASRRRIETWDSTRDTLTGYSCRLCGTSSVPDEARPHVPSTVEELERALAAWAAEEALASARELVEAYFVLPSPADILEALRRGEVVETTFRCRGLPLLGRRRRRGRPRGIEPILEREDDAPPSVPLPASRSRVGGPRDELLALASVAASDGDASADDQEALLRAAERRRVPPLAPDEIRVRRPARSIRRPRSSSARRCSEECS